MRVIAGGGVLLAWTQEYGRGRVFYSALWHAVESWDDPVLQQMYSTPCDGRCASSTGTHGR